ncbi:hypothetical protein ACFYYB_01875 [Streptomyces sp. NPDC002886]|uniref:hypothetical protein n=1 Tax=Streptomyces sp. NPDC002886 TaxID=3364667 RepID=UPI0036B3EE34
MPRIAVDYSASLSDSFDRRGFASAPHALTVEVQAELSAAVLDLLFKHLSTGADGAGPVVHASVDVDEWGAAHHELVQ